MRVCLLATLLAGVALAHAGKIKHVVVLMEENRSFDHMFGYGAQAGMKIDGLTGDETNPLSTLNPNGKRISVDDKSPYIGLCGPDHSTGGTTQKIFGLKAVLAKNFTDEKMDGFVERANELRHLRDREASQAEWSRIEAMFARTPILPPIV